MRWLSCLRPDWSGSTTNKVETIVAAITANLKAAGINTSCYRWPEAIQNVGNAHPLALIKEEAQEFILTSGQRYEYELTLSITLVSDVLRNRMQYMNIYRRPCLSVLPPPISEAW